LGGRIGLIPAGERWPDGSLRPSLEDLPGAGAILRALPGTRSPEAEAAVAVFNHFRDRLLAPLSTCGSGLEIANRSLPGEISLAADYNASLAAPRLIDGAYRSTQTSQN
jgi:2-phosphosulfolactate phosphatase